LQGGFVLITSIESRIINSAWRLGVLAGILEIFVGFWACQQLVTVRAARLIIWVGLLALFRDITEIALAFELKARNTAEDWPQLAASPAPTVCLRRWRYLAADAKMAADAPTRLQQGEVRSAWSWSGSR